jgi:hypothetical protein
MRLHTALLLSLALCVGACGGAPDESGDWGLDESALTSANGLSTNGLSTNGLSTNGLSTNGLSTNGLSTNGLSTNGFSAWFTANPASYSNMVMNYVVRCAMSGSQSLTYTVGGITYTWKGNLGLAPKWSSGQPASAVEKELVSACLAAHANKFGFEVAVSVRGHLESGAAIAVSPSEATTYSADEGCYWGNLFDGSGVWSAYSSASPLNNSAKSSARACAVNAGHPGSCAPIVTTGSTCDARCTAGTLPFSFTSCSVQANTRTYRAISVRISPAIVQTCGDGGCGPGETCYSSTTGLGCQQDCGKCP